MTAAAARPAIRQRPTTTGPLCVLVGCHDLVCAIETAWTERLVLLDEVRSTRPAGGVPTRPGTTLVESGGATYAAWDLGSLLGMPPTARAWVLLKVPHRDGTLRLALRTGPCLVVRTLSHVVELPAGIFGQRGGGCNRAFPLREHLPRAAVSVGTLLDVTSLWTTAERDASAEALARAGQAAVGPS